MIQGGGFDESMKQKDVKAPIKNEAKNGLSNKALTIAMARTNDPDSATAQFFINLVDNPNLDYKSGGNPGYAVFGKVIDGADTVKKIAKATTESKGYYDDVPSKTIKITKVTVKDQP